MEPIATNTRVTAFLAIIALAFAMLLGLFTSQWIAQPIIRLTTAAKKLAAGQWEQSMPAGRFHEVCDLADSFMRMRDAIRQKMEQLEELNQTLEQKVEARTLELSKSVALQQREITERKRMEEALRQSKKAAEAANRAKSAFLASMSHEMRTPMNAILGFARLIHRDRELTGHHREHLDIIRRSGEHLLTLINDVLDMSKIESGRTMLNEKEFDPRHLLNDLKDMIGYRAEKKSLSLVVEISPDVPQHIRTDEIKLRQVLMNLIGNAVKFTEEGTVAVRAQTKADEGESFAKTLLFEIRDTGPGIAPEETDTLFDPFVQTETGRKSQEGTGLGLSQALACHAARSRSFGAGFPSGSSQLNARITLANPEIRAI